MGVATKDDVTTFSEAAELLGTDIRTISGLVKALGITTKRVRRNGLAKGLDADDMKRLEHALSPPVHCRCLPKHRRREPAALPA